MIVFITGASAGFGAAMARRFATRGNKLVIASRRRSRLDALATQLDTDVHVLELDVSDRQAVQQAVNDLPRAYANVDVLINNAGLALGLEPSHRTELDDWEQMVDTNIKGLMYCTRALLPGMVARDRGHIINIGSTAGAFPYPGGNVYGASKAFVHQFSLNLRADLLGTAVRVTNVEPGLAGGTEFSQVRFKGNHDKAAAIYNKTRPLTADDVADSVHWIASRPAHVNINYISMMPVCQAFGPLAIHRDNA